MYFPLFIDLSQKNILVVGAGTIAARRIRTLCGFAGTITVCAPQMRPEIRELSEKYPIRLLEERYTEKLLDTADLVLAATDDRELNRKIVTAAKERKIPANSCSEKELCDFYFPSIVTKDGLVIGLTASGMDHGLVKRTRMELEEYLGK